MRTTSTLRYALIAAIVLILGALGAWYFFIQAKQGEIEREASARGAGVSDQSFSGRLGSTYQNLVSNVAVPLVQQDEQAEPRIPQLAQVTRTPVAGAQFIETGTSTTLRFVERSTGYVFDVTPENLSINRRTNTLVPLIYEAHIAENDRFILQSLDGRHEIETSAAAFGTTTEEGLHALTVTPLPGTMRDITLDPAGDEFFYVAESPNGGVGMRSNWEGSEQSQIFASALTDWVMYRPDADRIVIAQRPADGVAGYAYEVGSGETLSPVVGNIPGLTILPHASSSLLIYSSSSAGGNSLFARVADNTSVTSLPVRTIAEKCVWSTREEGIAFCAVPQSQAAAGFLGSWYRGETHIADAWWRIDVRSLEATQLLSPGNRAVDVEGPIIDATGTYIAFTNAIDKTLWLLRIPYE